MCFLRLLLTPIRCWAGDGCRWFVRTSQPSNRTSAGS